MGRFELLLDRSYVLPQKCCKDFSRNNQFLPNALMCSKWGVLRHKVPRWPTQHVELVIATRCVCQRDTLSCPFWRVSFAASLSDSFKISVQRYETWRILSEFFEKYIFFGKQGRGSIPLFSVLESMFWGKKGGISHKMFSISAPEVAGQLEKVRTLGRMCIKNTLPLSQTRIIYQKSSRSPHQ